MTKWHNDMHNDKNNNNDCVCDNDNDDVDEDENENVVGNGRIVLCWQTNVTKINHYSCSGQ